jgi:RsiW-degrading membrane proteinase PrsW (M82 family)
MTLTQYILAILPGLIICFYIIRSDKFEKEPMGALLLSFILGTLLIIPVIVLGGLLEINSPKILATLFNCFIPVALVEEGLKLSIILYKQPFFNEPFDGIIYAVMVGMGFATAENLIFAGNHPSAFYIQRAFTTEIAHGTFSIILGYFVGQSKFSKTKKARKKSLMLGLLFCTLLHGMYDLFLILSSLRFTLLFALIILLGSIVLAYQFILIQVEKPPR